MNCSTKKSKWEVQMMKGTKKNKKSQINSGTLGAGPEYPSEHMNLSEHGNPLPCLRDPPSGTTSASAHSTSALRGLPAYQPDLSNILSIKSKREGSLRGGDEKVFVFYSGTIFSQRHFFYETFDPFVCHVCPRKFFCFAQKPPNDVRNG